MFGFSHTQQGEARSQDINSIGIGLGLPEYSILSTKRVNINS